ncbi:MAG TPA: ankyrin repeat domain-containing protein [Amoebophilaceae bacterium]|nr:ankyrin repeat domain-containing protein [Amoebophilaceae bacterium]
MKHVDFNTVQVNKWATRAAILSLTVALQAKSCSSSGKGIDQQTNQKQTPLILVEGMVNLANRVPGKQENALFYALEQNKQDVLDLVLERVSKNEINLRNPVASKEAFLQTVHPNGNPPLCQAIQLGKKEMAERLMETAGIGLTQANTQTGETPLMLAIEKQNMGELTSKLIDRLDPSALKAVDTKARTALHRAARCNAQAAFEQLYNKLAQQESNVIKQHLFQKDGNQYTVFASAYLPKNARLGKVLVHKDDAMFAFLLDCTRRSLSPRDYKEIELEIDALTRAKKIDAQRNIKLRMLLNS